MLLHRREGQTLRQRQGRERLDADDTANVYYDHPYHAQLDHALGIDFVNEADGGRERVAVELSADSARALVEKILAALASGEIDHGRAAHHAPASVD